MGGVGDLFDVGGLDGFGKAGPAAVGVELVEGGEEGLAGDDVDVEAGLVVVPRNSFWKGRSVALRWKVTWNC